MQKQIAILWKNPAMAGRLELINSGVISAMQGGQISGTHFVLDSAAQGRLSATIDGAQLERGAFATVVTVRTEQPFSFFLRDVSSEHPIYISEYNVIVVPAQDTRTYEQILKDIHAQGYIGKLDLVQNQPEESFENAAQFTRDMPCPIWLGISRDIRMFEACVHTTQDLGVPWDTVQPRRHHTPVTIDEMPGEPIRYAYFAGRGIGCRQDITRSLEQGVLPILNVISDDDGVRYEQKMFVTLETQPLTAEHVQGTHILVSDQYAAYPTPQSPEQKAKADQLHDGDILQDEETVFYLRVEAVNTTRTPKYAFMRIPQPNVSNIPEMSVHDITLKDGYDVFNSTGNVFMTVTLDGQPFDDIESAILLAPGEKASFVFKIPHRPIPMARAQVLIFTDFDEKLAEAIAFWRAKLDRIADIRLPERRIQEMMQAGFLHLDLVCFGHEPDGAVAPVVGVYTPIGTESTPIIQYIESVGDTQLAQRAIQYFMDKQRPDGFMQNFQTYMSETGCALWNAAEHFKYTRDMDYLRSVEDNLIRGCEYLINWAQQSHKEELRGKGYGMIYGKVADNELPYRSYLLNCTTYGGLKSCADVLAHINPQAAERIATAAQQLKENILESMAESFATAPVIPISDGTWCPARGPFAEFIGYESLFVRGGLRFSHGTMVQIADNGNYDIAYGVVEPDSIFANFIMKANNELAELESTAFSQPYYSMHPFNNLKRGETAAFIKEFYCNVSSLADRETYSFWEHLYQVSPHKTHEEGWFLMRCRWMLAMDDSDELSLLAGVPRAWLQDGEQIAVDGMATRFGRLSIQVQSQVSTSAVQVQVRLSDCEGRLPARVRVRIPHPAGRRAATSSLGEYCAKTESVVLNDFTGEADFVVRF